MKDCKGGASRGPLGIELALVDREKIFGLAGGWAVWVGAGRAGRAEPWAAAWTAIASGDRRAGRTPEVGTRRATSSGADPAE